MTKVIRSKNTTSHQRSAQFLFRTAMTKEEGRKSCHNEKKETSDKRKAQFPFLSSFTKVRKPRKFVIGKITTLGQRKNSFQMG